MTTPRSELHGVLVVDKAAGPTSHDVVAMARRALQTRAIGHTGTLDPMATGVLVLAVGEATKLVNHLTALDKAYRTTLRLGVATDSLDADGAVTAEREVPHLEPEWVRSVAGRFLGEIEQRVPLVSAIKVDGRALYERARKGQEIEAPVRRVQLESLEITAIREREIDLDLRCSKGFYVRSLGRDLAEALGTVGHLSALRRTANGFFTVADAVPQADLESARNDEARREALRSKLLPLDEVASRLPCVVLSDAGAVHARHGRSIPGDDVVERISAGESEGETRVALDGSRRVIALVEASGAGFRVVRGFRRD